MPRTMEAGETDGTAACSPRPGPRRTHEVSDRLGMLTATVNGPVQPGGAAQPPATAGITEIFVPSGVAVASPSRNRTSSLPT